MLKHADLPDRLWGKAILHSVYLVNRSPAAALGGIAPLQFRTKEPIDLRQVIGPGQVPKTSAPTLPDPAALLARYPAVARSSSP
jgi:hypothetical protein